MNLATFIAVVVSTFSETSTIPSEVQEDLRSRDPRLAAAYTSVHPIPTRRLQLRSSVHTVDTRNKHVVEFCLFLQGSW